MAEKDQRIANAWRVLIGEPVQPVSGGPWWHAFGRVREFPRTDGKPADIAHQLTVVSPSPVPPARAVELAGGSWGTYLRSWDHEPSNREKEAVIPEEFRQSEEELALWDALDDAGPDEDELAKRGALSNDDEDSW